MIQVLIYFLSKIYSRLLNTSACFLFIKFFCVSFLWVILSKNFFVFYFKIFHEDLRFQIKIKIFVVINVIIKNNFPPHAEKFIVSIISQKIYFPTQNLLNIKSKSFSLAPPVSRPRTRIKITRASFNKPAIISGSEEFNASP